MYFILFITITLLSWGVSALLNHRFKQYSKVHISFTGREVAERMLRENGLTDVTVTCTSGHLTDHYDPRNKTVNLSEDVYNSNSVAAAVAAHECGHALQHAFAYTPLKMRSALVPVVNFASKWVTWILLGGILLIETLGPQLLLAGIVLYALTTLFTFITLPVEINASQRAIAWLEQTGITDRETTPMASSALRSAAYTYVVAALSSLGTLVYYILIFLGRRD